jgi:hypothetical protein
MVSSKDQHPDENGLLDLRPHQVKIANRQVINLCRDRNHILL